MNKNKFSILVLLVCCFAFIGLPLVGETSTSTTSYTALANYRTAVRCYQQGKTYLDHSQWTNALSQAELGLGYDESISDLWFLSAYAGYQLGKTPSEVLPAIKKAVEQDKWVDYNKDGALLLYAELLSQTGDSQRALRYLEGGRIFPSSSREYLKILCYYRLGTEESYQQARKLVSEASRLYPEDMRFSQVFFAYEVKADLSFSPAAEKLGETFAQSFDELGDYPVELYLLSSLFAEAEVGQRRLQSFGVSGNRHPLYASLALKSGLFSEAQAYEYFCSFASNSISLAQLESFASLLTESSTKSALKAFLNGFRGTITQDTTGDGIEDLRIMYERGRPKQIHYDKNQDGVEDWIARCDFGVPTELLLPEAKTFVYYNKYPFVSSMELLSMSFKFVDGALDWTPVSITPYEPLTRSLDGGEFFVPQLKTAPEGLFPAMRTLAESAYVVNYPVAERPQAKVELSILDGKVRSAQYYEGKTLYAQLACEDGLPKTRNVDLDGDGWFELTQNFGFSAEKYLDYASPEEILTLYEELFGSLFFPQGIFIQQALLDKDLDMEFDFGQEYTSGRGIMSIWGNPLTQDWSAQYIAEGGTQNSTARFKLPGSADIVSVYLENQVPVRVTTENEDGLVYRDLTIVPVEGVYWLGEAGSADVSVYLKKKIDEVGQQGRSMIIQMEKKAPSTPGARCSGIKISNFYFGVLLDE
ncbi:MAG: hypothetical protein J6V63_02180 [Spirochaetaceae bacterium]|nr:hypothetical protein [Spirochaetaceae bacterium]